MIRHRKIGHSHKLTVPTVRKGVGIAQAGKQVSQNKPNAYHPGAGYGPYDALGSTMGSGGTIHIKKANRGKFNATKARTGKSTEELTHSKNAATRKRAIFAQNARKWHHHPDGGWIEQYAQGGRTINPAMGGQMIGGQHAYPPTVQYPPMYGFGGVLQSFAPFLSLIPGVGTAASLAAGVVGGGLEAQSKQKEQEDLLIQQKHQQALQSAQIGQTGITGNARPTFSWGGRLPETRLPISPSGLTLGHVPGYDSNSNYGGTNIPPEGWNYRMVKGKGEGTNWHRETNMNVHRHTYQDGGKTTSKRAFNDILIPKTEDPYWDYLNFLHGYGVQNLGLSPVEAAHMDNASLKKKGVELDKNGLKYRDAYRENEMSKYDPNKKLREQDYATYKDSFGRELALGGQIPGMAPVELEKQEVYQTPSGQMGQVDGPSHAQGGVDMELPENSFVWSDKLKTSRGTTFADEAARLGRMKAKYEKTLRA